MQIKSSPSEVDVDGVSYRITPFLGNDCFDLKMEFVNYFGDSLFSLLLTLFENEKEPPEIKPEEETIADDFLNTDIIDIVPVIIHAMVRISQRVKPQEFRAFCNRLLAKTRIIDDQGQERQINFNLNFHSGKMLHLYKLLYKVMEVNYSDFFVDTGALSKVVSSLRGQGNQ